MIKNNKNDGLKIDKKIKISLLFCKQYRFLEWMNFIYFLSQKWLSIKLKSRSVSRKVKNVGPTRAHSYWITCPHSRDRINN